MRRLTHRPVDHDRAPRHRRTSTVAALCIAGALLVGACGSGRSSADGDPTATTAGDTTTGVAQFGDLASPCGPGDPSGSPDQAVDATSITIGYGDDAGFQGNPGSNHEMSDAVKALIGWCNEQGGIGGRQVKGVYYDAKITEVNNVMTEACRQVFMLVGQGFALGAGGEVTRLGCGLPSVPGLLGGTDVANAPLMVSPAPQPVDYMNVEGAAAIAEAHPDAVKKVGVMLPNFPATIDFTQRAQRTFPTVGWQFLDCTQTYPISGVSDFRPFLQKLKDCGAQVVLSTDTGNNLQNALDAARQIDFAPIWMTTSAIYTSTFANWNVNGNADQVYFGNVFVPLEDVTPGTANATYVDVVKASGGDISYTGQQAASAFLLWATAAKACGNEVTRACVMQHLKEVHDWTAGGLSSAQDPGGNKPGDCGLVIKVQGPAFVQWQPDTPGRFSCDPSYLAKVDPPIDSAASLLLDADRVAHKNETG
jgi:ABC-type branched-subunit amino acid transport system substrate-binding protein